MIRKCSKCRKEFEPESKYYFLCTACKYHMDKGRLNYHEDVRFELPAMATNNQT